MKKTKFSCKQCLLLWVITFAVFCVALDFLVAMELDFFTVDGFRVVSQQLKYRLLSYIFLVFWSLPLAIITYRKAKNTNKKVRVISFLMVLWLTIVGVAQTVEMAEIFLG